jgi:ribosome-binding factor A
LDHNKPYDRIERVNSHIHDILGGILKKNIDLNYLGFVTLTKVDVSRDLRLAKVFYSVFNPTMSMEKINIEINKHRKPFKKYMSPELSMKHTPNLKFYYDDTFEYTKYVCSLMKNIDISDN